MSSFKKTYKLGREGINDLLPLLEQASFQGRFILTDKGNLSEFLQKSVGDIIFNCKDDKTWGIEVKTEQEKIYPNFFLETWSNLSRFKLGWMYTLNTDFLWYYFQKDKLLYSINFELLRQWAFQKQKIYEHPEKRQKKYDQLNDTWGRCVPIKIIEQEVGYKLFDANTHERIMVKPSNDNRQLSIF